MKHNNHTPISVPSVPSAVHKTTRRFIRENPCSSVAKKIPSSVAQNTPSPSLQLRVLQRISFRLFHRILRRIVLQLRLDRLPQINPQIVRQFNQINRHICNLHGNLITLVLPHSLALLCGRPLKMLQEFR